jgi:hypothetical protein
MEVFDRAKRKGALLVVDQGGHSDLPQVAGEDYWRWISESLQPLLVTDKTKRA